MAREYDLLEIENLNTSFKIDAGKVLSVNGVSLKLEKGKVLGIVGESGSGKSVTAYSIMQILDKNGQIDSGKIIYNGTNLVNLSEEEIRHIRGNRISIIFQDAMTSLNPTWSIGNQLREAILTHAKTQLEEKLEEIENEIRSDRQRIEALNKGITNHPEKQELKDDLKFVEDKLNNDLANFEKQKEIATTEFEKNKAASIEKYNNGKVEYNKKIKEALKEYLKYVFCIPEINSDNKFGDKLKEFFVGFGKNFKTKLNKLKIFLTYYFSKLFKFNPLENEEEILELKDYKDNLSPLNQISGRIERQVGRVKKLKDEIKEIKGETEEEKEKKQILSSKYRKEKNILKRYKEERKEIITNLRNISYSYKWGVLAADHREKRKVLVDAFKAKYVFYWECMSEYKETKYSANLKAIKMLNEVGITEPEKRMKQYPFELSGGMLQRCMIAMALVQKPDILIADEPTTALDVTIQAQILELLKKLQKEYGMAIILITHDLGVIAQICDEVDIMYAGRIVEKGSVDEIFYNPQHEYTRGLLNSMPKLDQNEERLEPIKGNPVDLFCLPKGCAFSSRCSKCMEICIDKYPESVEVCPNHHVSCFRAIKELHDKGEIDVVNGTPEGKPLIYNGAIIAEEKKKGKRA